jgi:hypothetical protein
MGLFSFWGKRENATTEETVKHVFDLRENDSPVENLPLVVTEKSAIISAVENMLGGKTKLTFVEDLKTNNFSRLLMSAKMKGLRGVNHPHSVVKIKDFHSVPGIELIKMTFVETAKPLVISFTNSSHKVRHAYALVGYDENDQSFILKSSRGEVFGENGYLKMPIAELLESDFQAFALGGLSHG